MDLWKGKMIFSYELRRKTTNERGNDVNENVLKNILVILNSQFAWDVCVVVGNNMT